MAVFRSTDKPEEVMALVVKKLMELAPTARELEVTLNRGYIERDNYETQMVESEPTDGWTFSIKINGGAAVEATYLRPCNWDEGPPVMEAHHVVRREQYFRTPNDGVKNAD